jgi:hypothetical protein
MANQIWNLLRFENSIQLYVNELEDWPNLYHFKVLTQIASGVGVVVKTLKDLPTINKWAKNVKWMKEVEVRHRAEGNIMWAYGVFTLPLITDRDIFLGFYRGHEKALTLSFYSLTGPLGDKKTVKRMPYMSGKWTIEPVGAKTRVILNIYLCIGEDMPHDFGVKLLGQAVFNTMTGLKQRIEGSQIVTPPPRILPSIFGKSPLGSA